MSNQVGFIVLKLNSSEQCFINPEKIEAILPDNAGAMICAGNTEVVVHHTPMEVIGYVADYNKNLWKTQ